MSDDTPETPRGHRGSVEPEVWFRHAFPGASPEAVQAMAGRHRSMVDQGFTPPSLKSWNELTGDDFAAMKPGHIVRRPTTEMYSPTPEMRVTTNYNGDVIESIIESYAGEPNRYREFSRKIIKLQDEGVREALIALGWTPPKDDEA